MFDYESLRVIWWVLIGVLCIGFAITDGFDSTSIKLPLSNNRNYLRRDLSRC